MVLQKVACNAVMRETRCAAPAIPPLPPPPPNACSTPFQKLSTMLLPNDWPLACMSFSVDGETEDASFHLSLRALLSAGPSIFTSNLPALTVTVGKGIGAPLFDSQSTWIAFLTLPYSPSIIGSAQLPTRTTRPPS